MQRTYEGPDAIGAGIATLTLGCSDTSLTVKDALMVNIPVLAGAAAVIIGSALLLLGIRKF